MNLIEVLFEYCREEAVRTPNLCVTMEVHNDGYIDGFVVWDVHIDLVAMPGNVFDSASLIHATINGDAVVVLIREGKKRFYEIEPCDEEAFCELVDKIGVFIRCNRWSVDGPLI